MDGLSTARALAANPRLPGINSEEVIRLVKRRADLSISQIDDGRKLALLVEGGGMRGVCSAGGLVALDALCLRNAFDHIYATSAGAMNAAYFLAGQTVFGIQIYYKEINNKRFINYHRFTKVVDIDFLFDQVVTQVRRLDTEAVLKAPSEFYISVVDRQSGKNLVLRARDYPDEILSLFKATTALPVVYNRAVPVGSRLYIDGGLGSPVPLYKAIENGCTDLLVFLTRPASYRSRAAARLEKFIFSAVCARGNRELVHLFETSHTETNTCRQICLGKLGAPKPVNIATFCPSETDTLVDRLTIDGRHLKQSAIDMAVATLRQFGGTPDLIADLVST